MIKKLLLGYDLGSSSVKASLLDATFCFFFVTKSKEAIFRRLTKLLREHRSARAKQNILLLRDQCLDKIILPQLTDQIAFIKICERILLIQRALLVFLIFGFGDH